MSSNKILLYAEQDGIGRALTIYHKVGWTKYGVRLIFCKSSLNNIPEWIGFLCYIQFLFIILYIGLGLLYIVKICAMVGEGA